MDKSDNISELAKALHKAQGSIKTAIKDANNPFFKSKYADLGAIWDACRDALQSAGLSISQVPNADDDGKPVLDTILMHTSGQWISGKYPITPIKNDPQGVGSAITYARRYALQAIVGICADVDDDGEAALGRGTAKKQTSTGEAYTKQPKWTPEQVKEAGEIRAVIIGHGGDPADKEVIALKSRMKGDAPADVIDALNALRAKWSDIANQSTQEG